jgi:hypothetical protein
MARKSPVSHAVAALFSVPGKDVIDALVGFSSLKKLGWSPDVKVAMAKMPASNIGDAVWSALQDVKVQVLHDTLDALLKPIKQHQLFDLSDWLRDLSGGHVPDYLQDHWSNNRVPKVMDDLVKRALEVEDQGDVADGGADEEEWDEAGVTPRTRKSPARKKPALKLVGKTAAKKSRGSKVSLKHEGKPADEKLNAFDIPLKDAAVDALRDGKMSDKMRWQRVNRYMDALLHDYGYRFRSSPKRETEAGVKDMSRMTYFIEERDDGPKSDLKAMVKHMERSFGNAFDSYEELENGHEARQFKAWFKHA